MPRPKVTCSRRGKPFEEEIERSLKHFKLTHKIRYKRSYDVSDYIGRSCPKCHAPITHCNNPHCLHVFPELGMMPPKQDSDFWAQYGTMYLLECKSTKSANGFMFTQYNGSLTLKDHQRIAMMENVMCKGKSVVLICNRSKPRKPILYALKIQDYVNLECEGRFAKWGRVKERSMIEVERIPYKGEPYYIIEEVFER